MMTAIEVGANLAELDAAVQALPNAPAVFVLWTAEGPPYLSKTALLRRRLLRLLSAREKPSKILNLRHAVRRIEYRLTGSALESSLLHYEQARRYFPETYLDELKLRMPPYVRIVVENEYPRSRVTTHLTRGGFYFGPFRARASAERFEQQFLDLFQLRRCQEDLAPSPGHPGCIYGEMAMCLRPCQEAVSAAEYAHEAARVTEFLTTGGRSLVDAIAHSRDRMSEEMAFEEAARLHKRLEKVQEVLKLRDELAREIDHLNGVAVVRSLARDAVELWCVRQGYPRPLERFSFEVEEGKAVSLDRKLREALAAAAPVKLTVRERQEQLALLARWCYSSWREGEWLGFDGYEDIPYRKLVHAVSRVARRETAG
jgi:excinuclease ABC subunit C